MASRKRSDMLLTLLIGSLILWILYRFLKTKPVAQEVILKELTRAGIDEKTARFWVAVSAHETAFANSYQTPWTSPVYIQNRNLFGMRLPSGNTTAIGSNLGHAVYPSIQDSAKDLILYFQRLRWDRVNFNSIPELVTYMKQKGYYEAPLADYQRGVEYWYKKLGL
jgi:hypothetical protein